MDKVIFTAAAVIPAGARLVCVKVCPCMGKVIVFPYGVVKGSPWSLTGIQYPA